MYEFLDFIFKRYLSNITVPSVLPVCRICISMFVIWLKNNQYKEMLPRLALNRIWVSPALDGILTTSLMKYQKFS